MSGLRRGGRAALVKRGGIRAECQVLRTGEVQAGIGFGSFGRKHLWMRGVPTAAKGRGGGRRLRLGSFGRETFCWHAAPLQDAPMGGARNGMGC